MPVEKPAPLSKRKKLNKIITDLSHITQDEYDSEPEASEFDLGKKIKTPRDIMLEELSLMKNKGSKMFKMRKIRVEKFIWENNPDVFTSDSMDHLQKFVPTTGGQMGGQMINLGGAFVSKQAGHLHYTGLELGGGGPPVPPPKPGSKGARGAGGAGGAGGTGGVGGGDQGLGGAGGAGGDSSSKTGAGKDDASKIFIKTYISPWEKAMKGDEGLIATLKSYMPGPVDRMDLPKYRSFNRFAMPYGGFEKATQLMKFQLPEASKQEPEEVVYPQEGGCRPSFNRTPIGWVGSSEPSSIHMEGDAVAYDAETDEL